MKQRIIKYEKSMGFVETGNPVCPKCGGPNFVAGYEDNGHYQKTVYECGLCDSVFRDNNGRLYEIKK